MQYANTLVPFPQIVQSHLVHFILSAVIILFLLCLAVSTFFKKSNVFLIISLFALAVCCGIFAITYASNVASISANIEIPEITRSNLKTTNLLHLARFALFALGYVILGAVAVFARMGKTKATNLWWLAGALFLLVVGVAVIFAVTIAIQNFEQVEQVVRMFVNGWYSIVEFFMELTKLIGTASMFFGTSVMSLINCILLGTYLKKLSKIA